MQSCIRGSSSASCTPSAPVRWAREDTGRLAALQSPSPPAHRPLRRASSVAVPQPSACRVCRHERPWLRCTGGLLCIVCRRAMAPAEVEREVGGQVSFCTHTRRATALAGVSSFGIRLLITKTHDDAQLLHTSMAPPLHPEANSERRGARNELCCMGLCDGEPAASMPRPGKMTACRAGSRRRFGAAAQAAGCARTRASGGRAPARHVPHARHYSGPRVACTRTTGTQLGAASSAAR
jgi:hypothetical protein